MTACCGCLLPAICLAGAGAQPGLTSIHTPACDKHHLLRRRRPPAPAGLRRSGGSGASRQTSCFLPMSRPGRRHSCPTPMTTRRPKVACLCWSAGWLGWAGLGVLAECCALEERRLPSSSHARCCCCRRTGAWSQEGQVASRQQPAEHAQLSARCRGARQGARRRRGTRTGLQLSVSWLLAVLCNTPPAAGKEKCRLTQRFCRGGMIRRGASVGHT